MSFSTPNVAAGYLSTPQKANALNALEMLGQSTFQILRQVAQAKMPEEPSPARLEGANALAMLFDSSTPLAMPIVRSLARTYCRSYRRNSTPQQLAWEGNASCCTRNLNTPSVPKVRRFSPAAGKASRKNQASTLYTPLNEKARSKGLNRKNKGQKKKTEGGKESPTATRAKRQKPKMLRTARRKR